MSPETALLKTMFPTTKTPLVCSAPMLTISGPELIATISKAGGLGFLGAGYDLGPLSQNLATTQALLQGTNPLPIGVGVIVFRADLTLWLSSLKPHTPAAVWLFAPSTQEQLNTWILSTKAECPEVKTFVQVGSVAELKALLKGEASEGVDVIVAQGVADSGGHGLQRGASIVPLVPAFRVAIEEMRGNGEIRADRVMPVVAAGGVMGGKGAAAALALGANGVALGTRFIPTPECGAPDGLKKYLLSLTDGGQDTIRTRIFDTLRGTGFWPPQYNGRCATNHTLHDFVGGLSEAENKVLYDKAVEAQDWNRLTMFFGTGAGLVKEMKPAGDVVVEVREGAIKALKETLEEFGA